MKDNTPGKHPSDSPTHGTGAGHELSELRIGPVVWFLVALTIEAAAMAQVPLAGTNWIPGLNKF